MQYRDPYTGQVFKDVEIIDPTTPPKRRLDILLDAYILPSSRMPEMISLGHRIVGTAIREGRASDSDPISQLQAILDWQARAVRYQEDPTDEKGWQLELFKSPAKAISDQEDDCEGKVAVTATLFNAIGYPAWPVWIEQEQSRNNHVGGKVVVPARFAKLVRPAGSYAAAVVYPSHVPRAEGVQLWFETTLSDVGLPDGRIVRGPLIGEHPYDVVARFRAAGITRLSL